VRVKLASAKQTIFLLFLLQGTASVCVCETRRRKANHFHVVLAADSRAVI
jgi:hypothetical protein